MSQTNQIRAHLDRGRSITPMDALAMFGSFRLAARIKDLRDQGYPVNTQIIEFNGKKFAKYTKDTIRVRREFDEVIGGRR